MPKKLSSAVAGTLAVGLTLPASAAAAQAITASDDSAPDQPLTGTGDMVPAASLTSGVEISTGHSAGSFTDPLAGEDYTFSTGQGPRCISMQGASAHHLGQDLVADEGTPFSAVSDGTVVRTVQGTPSRAGVVVVRHNIGGQVYHSGYLHVWDAESHVAVGDSVRAGQTIGEVGDSGPTITPHLHLEIWKGGWHTGTSLDPADWLAERGVDLRESAEGVQQREVPSSCDYYAAESTPLRADASPTAEVLTQLPRAAELTSAPGDAANGFVRVTADGQTGWVRQGHLTPNSPAASTSGTTTSAGFSESHSPQQYRVTEPLYARSGPGTDHAIRQGMPTDEQITVTAESGQWVQFTRRGEQVWSHGAYLEQDEADTGGTHAVTTPLNLRSGPGASHSIVGGMPAGERVTVVDSDGDWLKIRRADGQQGWSHGAYLTDGSTSSSSSSEESDSAGSGSGSSAEAAAESGSQDAPSGAVADSRAAKDAADSDSTSSGSSSSAESADSSPAEQPAPADTDSSQTEESAEDDSETGDSRPGDSDSEPQPDSETGDSRPGDSASESQPDSEASGQQGSSAEGSDPAPTHRVTEGLNLRSGPGNSHGVVSGMPAGERVTVVDSDGDWLKIRRVDGQQGWSHGTYLDDGSTSSSSSSEESDSAESDADSSAEDSDSSTGTGSSDADSSDSELPASSNSSTSSASDDSSAESESDAEGASTTAWVNMRSGAGTDSSVQRAVAPETAVDVLDRSAGWYQVRVNGHTGWIWHEYLDVPDDEEPASSSSGSNQDSAEQRSSSEQPSSSSQSSGSAESSGSSSDASSSSDSAEEADSSSGSSSSDSSSSSSSSSEADSSSGSSSSGSTSDQSGSESAQSDSDSESSQSSASSSSDARTTSGVNMRSGAGLDHGVIRTVSGGVGVDIVDQQGGWYQVRVNGNTGWIWQDFLDVPGGASASSQDSSGSASSDSSSSDSSGSESSSSDSSSSESSSSDSGSSSDSSSSGSGPAGSGSSNSGSSGSSSGRSGPSSGQHAQSSHGPYSSVWDRLAQCESTGNWSINTGNGYYGGVQFSAQSWRAVGGSGLPHQASKQEQIERAYALWQLQGWGAWPSCSAQLNLSGDPGGWGDSYFDVHGGTESASTFAAAGQWTATYSVPLREDPAADSDKLAQVPRGEVLDAGERSGTWVQVEFSHEGETLTGWVNTRFVTAA